MMFHSEVLRVVLATVHVPLADVPALLTRELVEATIRLTAAELPRFGFPEPRLAMAGLNPHAGEHGLLGREDERVLRPAVEACRQAGIDVVGPLPADTVFVSATRGKYDAVVACYHDQGLIPSKTGRVRPYGQRDARAADRSDVGRPWHRVRYRQAGCGRSVEHGGGRAARGAARDGHGQWSRRRMTERARGERPIAENRKAFHDFHILDTFEAGIVLTGTEVKAIREGRVNLRDSFGRVEAAEVFVYNIHISPVQPPWLCRARADAAAQALVAQGGDFENWWARRSSGA